MRVTIIRVLLLFHVALCLALQPSKSAAESIGKYNRAMVFHGGGFQTAVFLGMLAAAEDAGKAPDVIVATCGGSIGAAIATAFSTSKERMDFLRSRDFHAFLRAIEIRKEYANPIGIAKFASQIHLDLALGKRPDVFENYLLQIPDVRELHLPANTSTTLRSVILASRIEFKRGETGKAWSGASEFTETFFTDTQTAELLKGFQTPIANLQNSRVAGQTQVVTNVPAIEAARAGVADPYLMSPHQINGDYYLTGAVDLYPIEVAAQVANETIMTFPFGFDPWISGPVIRATYGFNSNQRLRSVTAQFASYWVDQSDFPAKMKTESFFPVAEWGFLRSGVPEDYAEYLRRIEIHWQLGYERAKEALAAATANRKNHIRNMDRRNSTTDVRRSARSIQLDHQASPVCSEVFATNISGN